MQLRRWIIPVHLRKRKTAVHQRQAGMGDVFSFHAIVIMGIETLQPDMWEGSIGANMRHYQINKRFLLIGRYKGSAC